jgi:hypothetical protein
LPRFPPVGFPLALVDAVKVAKALALQLPDQAYI